MRLSNIILPAVLFLTFILSSPTQAQWPPPTDNTSCYPWEGEDTWCNLHDPYQGFYRAFTNDDYNSYVTVTVGGTSYHVRVRIYDVYNSNYPYNPITNCVGGTPARYWDYWACDTNTDDYFQNHDTCEGGLNKAFRYCWPVAGCISVTSADGAFSSAFAAQLDIYLDAVGNMLRPAASPPLSPSPGSRVVYAIRPYPSTCSCP